MVRVRKRPHPKKPRLFVVAVHGADISKQGKKAHAFVDEMEAMIRSVVEAEGYDTLRVGLVCHWPRVYLALPAMAFREVVKVRTKVVVDGR